jgi:hypothetical protein
MDKGNPDNKSLQFNSKSDTADDAKDVMISHLNDKVENLQLKLIEKQCQLHDLQKKAILFERIKVA